MDKLFIVPYYFVTVGDRNTKKMAGIYTNQKIYMQKYRD